MGAAPGLACSRVGAGRWQVQPNSQPATPVASTTPQGGSFQAIRATRAMPAMRIVDMRLAAGPDGRMPILSAELREAVRDRLDNGRKVGNIVVRPRT